ncbi:glycine/betaine/sarcosine/D-proline family reductase selenoprotein B [Salirhabdus salicampi]|nr:glycine/betaine/sarcosine/D-proline family reductase selenoprotein B [Salirhabdus salicampi]
MKPLEECKIALISTAGVHKKDDKPFDIDNPKGDHSIRTIPSDATENELSVTHIYYDTKYAKIDSSIVFPIKQLQQLRKDGIIGSLAERNIGLNGGILDTHLVEKESIPKVTQILKEDQVDATLLLPG